MSTTSSWLDKLHLRFTYGFNGNVEKSTARFTLLSMSQTPSSITGFPEAYVSNYGNPDLRWEKTSTVNFGIDFSLWRNFLFGSIDMYAKNGKEIIGDVTLPSISGTSHQKINNAEISNRGIELTLGLNTPIVDDINFSTKLTYAYNKNKVKNLYQLSNRPYDLLGRDYYVEGYPIGAMFAYTYLGMEDEMAYVQGLDGTKIAMNDTSAPNSNLGLDFLEYMGPGIDPHTLGWQGSFSGYGFSLSYLFTGKFGGHFRAPTFNYNISTEGHEVLNTVIRDIIEGTDKLPSLPSSGNMLNGQWNNYTGYLNTLVESSSFV